MNLYCNPLKNKCELLFPFQGTLTFDVSSDEDKEPPFISDEPPKKQPKKRAPKKEKTEKTGKFFHILMLTCRL